MIEMERPIEPSSRKNIRMVDLQTTPIKVCYTSSVVLLAKCPIAGKSKTRLIPLLGATGAATLAEAMLCDVVQGITDTCNHYSGIVVDKILLYAPPTKAGLEMMRNSLVNRLGEAILSSWTLLPVVTTSPTLLSTSLSEDDRPTSSSDSPDMSTNNNNDSMTSSHLSEILTHAVLMARHRLQTRAQEDSSNSNADTTVTTMGPVLLMGMDSPEIPIDEFWKCIVDMDPIERMDPNITNSLNRIIHPPSYALICPAADGGYGLLSIPPTIPNVQIPYVFTGIVWSHQLTALSQIKAFTDLREPHIVVRLGRVMHDMDEPEDVLELVKRLATCSRDFADSSGSSSCSSSCSSKRNDEWTAGTDPIFMNVLHRPSSSGAWLVGAQTTPCPWTRQALKELKLFDHNGERNR